MKKMLYICAITTAACLSLYTAYSSDSPSIPRGDLENVRMHGKFKYPLLNEADWELKQYANYAKQGFSSNTRAINMLNSMDRAQNLILDKKVKIVGNATKETNDWYLNFVIMKSQDLRARLENNGGLTTSFLDIMNNEFDLKEVNNETLFKEDPTAKLHFQLGILIVCSIFGLDNVEKLFTDVQQDSYFHNFKDTLNDLKMFIPQLKNTKPYVNFSYVKAVYNDKGQSNLESTRRFKFLNVMPSLVYKPEISEQDVLITIQKLKMKMRTLNKQWTAAMLSENLVDIKLIADKIRELDAPIEAQLSLLRKEDRAEARKQISNEILMASLELGENMPKHWTKQRFIELMLAGS